MRRILFPAPLTFDLLGYGNEVFIDEILLRAGLMMGTFDANISAYGIVDSSDPRTTITGDDRAFSVKANATLANTIDIKPGIAVFQSGEIIIINEAVLQIALADNAANSRNIVYLNFAEISTDPVLTRHNALTDSIVSYLTSNAEYIKVLKKDDYDALSSDVRDLTIPLAIVTNQIVTSSTGGTVTRTTIDMTRNTYSNNRPWFSVVDAEHRSHLGTGSVTSANIHGLSINDLSAAGDLTFLQVALDHGMIVSKDRGIAGVPGSLCTEVIQAAVMQINTAITGIAGARYFTLTRVPRLIHRVEIPIKAFGSITINLTVGPLLDDETFTLNDGVNPAVVFKFDSNNSVTETNTLRRVTFTGSNTSSQVRDNIVEAVNAAPVLDITAAASTVTLINGIVNLTNDRVGIIGNTTAISITETVANAGVFIATGMSGGIVHELAPFWVPGSNIVSLLPTEELAASYMNVIYTAVDAAEPIRDPVNPTFKVKTPTSTEVLISGGLFLDNITGTEITFENEGPIPSKYTVYVDSAGSLQKFPQTVFCYKKLSDIGFALQSFENQILGNARLKVFLAHATSVSLDIRIQITGLDTTGTTVTETVKFGTSWAGYAAPYCGENPNQYIITDTTWSSVSNIIVAQSNDSTSTAILIQALIDPVSVSVIADVLPVAEIIWDGQQVCTIRDIRPINTSLSLPNYMNLAAAGPMTAAFNASIMPGAGFLYQYWAEDFDKPRLVTTEVTDTTALSGLAPTDLTLTKIAKGLGRNDVYISRPIPVKPYDGSAVGLRFVPVQSGAEFTLKVRYYTTLWSNWTTLTAPYDLPVAVSNLVKWQMVVTGPVEGMFVILKTVTGNTHLTTFIANYGAWIDGVFL